MVARKFSVRHNGVDFDVDYDTDDGLEVFRIQLFSLTSVPPDEQKILAVDNDRLVSDESDLAAISDRLQLVSIDEEEKVEKLVEEKSMEEASSSDAELLSDEELARMLQAEEEALMMQQYVVGQNKEEASSSDAELLSDEELARMLQAEEEALMMQQYVVGQNKEEASSSVAELLSDEELARMLQYPVRPDAKQKMKETEESKEKLGQTKSKVKNEAAAEENSGQTKFKVKNEAAPEENSEQTESKRKEIKREEKKAPSGLNEHIKYPVRPDAEDCANYMRTWICKFGSNCKFNHPVQKKVKAAKQKKETEEFKVKNEAAAGENSGQTKSKFYSSPEGCKFGKGCKFSHMKTNYAPPPVELNFMGLPMRSGVKDCPYLMRNGTCMSDVNCKFNHPDPTPVIDDEPFLQDIHGEIESTSSQSTQPFPSPK